MKTTDNDVKQIGDSSTSTSNETGQTQGFASLGDRMFAFAQDLETKSVASSAEPESSENHESIASSPDEDSTGQESTFEAKSDEGTETKKKVSVKAEDSKPGSVSVDKHLSRVKRLTDRASKAEKLYQESELRLAKIEKQLEMVALEYKKAAAFVKETPDQIKLRTLENQKAMNEHLQKVGKEIPERISKDFPDLEAEEALETQADQIVQSWKDASSKFPLASWKAIADAQDEDRQANRPMRPAEQIAKSIHSEILKKAQPHLPKAPATAGNHGVSSKKVGVNANTTDGWMDYLRSTGHDI